MIYIFPKSYIAISNDGVLVIRGKGDLHCPLCNGRLTVHGTCLRKVRTTGKVYVLRLRVMKCGSCGRTHRELPHFLIPYKRYGLDAICEIICAESGREICSASAKSRIIAWFAWILAFSQTIIPGFRVTSWELERSKGLLHVKRLIMRIVHHLVWKNSLYSTVSQT